MKNILTRLEEIKFKEIPTKMKVWFLNLSKKQVIIFVVVVVAIGAIYKSNIIQDKFFAAKTPIKQNTTTVQKGNLKVLVSGSGPIYFTNSNMIYSKIGANVMKVNYKEGDKVKKGAVIYELDDTDAQTQLNSDLNSYRQSQVSADASNKQVNDLSVKAPFTGVVSDIAVSKGDTVQKGGTVFTIADTSKLKVLLTYNASAGGKIAVGQTAKVNITSLSQAVSGKVTYISNQAAGTTAGGLLYTVEIQINNPGAVIEGMTASADISSSKGVVSSTGIAALNYINKQLVTSTTGGTVQSIAVKQNEQVSSGEVLVTMSSDDITSAKENSDLQIQDAQAKVALSTKKLDDYKIVAPIDGVITKMANKVGDTVKAGDEVSDVSDPSKMEFDIPVDELDIAKLKVGQKTSITVDALPATTKTPVNGEVAKIAVTGDAESGVTTFVVTVKIDDNLGVLKGGMNANGDIQVSDKANILYVPIEAITTLNGKSYVYLKTARTGASAYGGAGMGSRTGTAATTATDSGSSNSSDGKTATAAKVNTEITGTGTGSGYTKRSGKTSTTSKKQNYYDGTKLTEVQIGSNNDTSIEITSGVKEGNIIVLPQTQAASTSTTSTKSSGLGSGGGNGGGGSRSGGGGF